MKKLNKEEAKQIAKKPSGRKSLVRAWVEQMEVGDCIQVAPSDWKVKSKGPSSACRKVEKGSRKRFQVYDLLDEEGWMIERVK